MFFIKNILSSVCRSLHKPIISSVKYSVKTGNIKYPRKIFSGIQPTGALHLGNYVGAVSKWVELQNSGEDVTFCIVDLHAITIRQVPKELKSNTLQMVAALIACGIDPNKSTLFLQSDVPQHTQLAWILECETTMPRLGHLPQFKEKSKTVKDVPLGLYVYPVLQAADILIYKATHVPVGEDQVQHLQLAQHLARVFNHWYGETFPIPHGIIADDSSSRLKSLRDPTKKMSKSDPDPKSCIMLTDKPEVILEKIKKGVTDFTSQVTYDPANRPGVSNLITIHSLMSGKTPEEICEENSLIDTGRYKLVVAEAVIEKLKPIRDEMNHLMEEPEFLMSILQQGAEKASLSAQETWLEVKGKVGIGGCTFESTSKHRKPDIQ